MQITLILVICLTVLLAVWYGVWFRATRPKRGTLEWIGLYDRRPFFLPGTQIKLYILDGPLALECGILGAVYGVVFRTEPAPWLIPALCALGIYLLVRLLGVGFWIGVILAVTAGICRQLSDGSALLFFSAAGFYAWAVRDPEDAFWKNGLAMLGALAALAGAMVWELASVWILPLYAALFVLTLVQRWHTGRFSAGKVWRAVGLTLLGLVAAMAAAAVVMATRAQAIQRAELLPALRYVLEQMKTLVSLPTVAGLAAIWQDFPVVLSGAAAFAVLAAQAIKQRQTDACFLVLLTFVLCLAWAFSGSTLVLGALAADTALVCTRLWQRDRKLLAILQPALILALELITIWI